MSKNLNQWLATDVAKAEKLGITKLSTEYFFRDPLRSNYIDHTKFFSPADGTILYQKFVKDPTKPIIEIKGINYTLQDVVQDPTYNKPSLVIGIFMSFYDPHIIRIPYGGIVKFNHLDSIESTNIPMLAVEKDLLNSVINPDNLGYLKNNERMLVDIYSPSLDYAYKMCLIADEDVNVIMPFTTEQNDFFMQNQRFALVRWGSQTELILPLDKRFNFELLQKTTHHIEAGQDALLSLSNMY